MANAPHARQDLMHEYGRAMEQLERRDASLARLIRSYVRAVNAESAFWRSEAQTNRRGVTK